MSAVVLGALLPFFGTVLGAASVLFMKCGFGGKAQKILSGFAGGVMVAASVWSLLIPAINMARESGGGSLAFIPAVTGLLAGIFFLFLLDRIISNASACGTKDDDAFRKSAMVLLAVTLHNIPEGMAVGAVFAGILADKEMVSLTGAFILSIGITIQNICGGYRKKEGFSIWYFKRCSRACQCTAYNCIVSLLDTGNALSAFVCGGSHDICCGGRIDPGSCQGRTEQCHDNGVCNWICIDDGLGCGTGVNTIFDMQAELLQYFVFYD